MRMACSQEKRAVLPSLSLKSSADAVEASSLVSEASPGGFGLGIYKVTNQSRMELPLFYVSSRACEARSPHVNMNMPAGVQEGWYVNATVGMRFEIAISAIRGHSSVSHMAPKSQAVLAELIVDRQATDTAPYVFGSGVDYHDVVEKGFARYSQNQGEDRKFGVIPFQLKKAPCRDQRETGEDIHMSSIVLKLSSARYTKRKLKFTAGSKELDLINEAARTEKQMAKKGLSLSCSRTGELQECNIKSFAHELYDVQEIPEFTIKVHLRERWWLETRMIINAEERLVLQHNILATVIRKKPIRSKRRRIQEEVLDLTVENTLEQNLQEIIDLTGAPHVARCIEDDVVEIIGLSNN